MDILKRMKEAEENAVKIDSKGLILEQFKAGAEEYWGQISSEGVVHNRTTGQGTEYFLVMATTDRDGVKGKLLQEWYVSKKGEARINPKRTVWISEDIVEDISDNIDI